MFKNRRKRREKSDTFNTRLREALLSDMVYRVSSAYRKADVGTMATRFKSAAGTQQLDTGVAIEAAILRLNLERYCAMRIYLPRYGLHALAEELRQRGFEFFDPFDEGSDVDDFGLLVQTYFPDGWSLVPLPLEENICDIDLIDAAALAVLADPDNKPVAIVRFDEPSDTSLRHYVITRPW